MQRESINFDVIIVGAGPAGLSTAIRLMQIAQQEKRELTVCIIEKGATVGAHALSGAVLEPSGLNALIPNWQQLDAPVKVAVTDEKFKFLSTRKSFTLPTPALMQNQGNYIISLSELCAWLAEHAQQLGVSIFPGFAASNTLYDERNSKVIGIQTGDMGLNKSGAETDRTQPGINIFAKQTVFAEGCRGSLTEKLSKKFNLRAKTGPQSYAIGVKELWKINNAKHHPGQVIHTIGWPLDRKTYGGGFVYHFKDSLLSIGLVIGLDYHNPYLDPFLELQRLKLHPLIKPLLIEGECISYGARALNEGGLQAIPKLTVPGGVLVGCSAGMVNVGKLKGIHNAMKSGILAAESIFQEFKKNEITRYQSEFKKSTIYKELHLVRNLRPGFNKGLFRGLCYAALDQYFLRGKAPWTFFYKPDHKQLSPKSACKPIEYPKPDHKITFDKSTQVFLTHTRHREQQPCHLKLKQPTLAVEVNFKKYAGPEARYCPAQVYDFVEKNDKIQLQINFTNCIHCKTCDIKDPKQNIVWTTPEGGDGPHYKLM